MEKDLSLTPAGRTAAEPHARRGVFARMFGTQDVPTAVAQLQADYALARVAIELEADLKRHRRKGHLYLETTALEDRAMQHVTKALRCRELLDQIDELDDADLFDTPTTAAVLKARVRALFHHRNGQHCRPYGGIHESP